MSDKLDAARKALSAFKRASNKEVVDKPHKVVQKITEDIDPAEVMCTTYMLRDMYDQFGTGYFSDLDVMNFIVHHKNCMMVKSGTRMLDVCCGRGAQLPLLRWHRKKLGLYVGVDISEANVRKAKRKSARKKLDGIKFAPNWAGQGEPYYPFDVHFVICSVSEMVEPLKEAGFAPGSFDHAMFKGIEHMQRELGIASLSQCYTMLHRGSTMLVTSPNTPKGVGRDIYDTQYAAHLYEWDRTELREEVEKAGFRILGEYGMLAKVSTYRDKLRETYPDLWDLYTRFAEYLPREWLMAFFPIVTPDIADEVVLIVERR